MMSAYTRYGQSIIHYQHCGSGALPIVALHGYGESSSSFSFLESCLDEQYLLVAIDLPFHGLTKWTENRPFAPADMNKILADIFASLALQDMSFMLIGYSMGGRLALSMMQHQPQKISRLLLLAPDGMKVNFWYWLATQTRMGNRLFLSTMKNPSWFLGLMHFANRFNLINRSVHKFIFSYVTDEKIRLVLYHRWTCMQLFKPDLFKIQSIIKNRKIPVRLLYGKHDRIILSKRASPFTEGLQPYCQLHIIDAGHNILQKKYAGVITNLLTT